MSLEESPGSVNCGVYENSFIIGLRCRQPQALVSAIAGGLIERKEDYRALLAEADVVLSTAIHDFQGLSVLEAVAAGLLNAPDIRSLSLEWLESRYHQIFIQMAHS